jgi:mono/diheme cytochrome c family protein
LREKIILIGIALLLAGLISACTAHSERPDPSQAQVLIEEGKTLYLEQCAECHQVDGSGWSTLYPRLAGNPIVTLHDPAPIIETVTYGQGSMMSFQYKLRVDEIAAVLSYIRNAWGNHAPPVSPHQIH